MTFRRDFAILGSDVDSEQWFEASHVAAEPRVVVVVERARITTDCFYL